MTRQFEVVVKAGSKHGPLIETGADGSMKVYLRERALDGKANVRLIELIAKHYDTSKSRIKIVRGLSSKYKLIRIDG